MFCLSDPVRQPPVGLTAAPGAKVLLVEDDALIRMVATAMLEDEGYQVEEAGTGAQALATLAADTRISLMIVDLGLPDMSGVDVVVRARQARPGIRVIIASGGAADPNLADVVLLPKPYDNATLTAAVRRAAAGGVASGLH